MELPASFIDYTRALLGDEEYDKLAVAIQQEPPVSIRLNDGKLKIENGKCRIVPQAGCITDFQLSAFNLNLIKSLGLPKDFTWMSVSLSRLIHCFMQVVIMFRRLLLCLWSRCSGSMSPDR